MKNPERASEYLAKELPERTVTQWSSWLRNNRNHAKPAVYRIPTVKLGREVLYSPDELAEFVRFQKQLRIGDVRPVGRVAEALAAFGVGAGGSGTGHTWEQPRLYAAMDEVTQAPYVQLHIPKPRLMVYRLELEAAEEFARALMRTSAEARSTSAHIAPDQAS